MKMVLGTVALHVGSEDPIAGYEAFRNAAFAAQSGDFPELIDLSDGGVVALRLESIDEPAPIPLADIKDRVAADWKAAETVKALAAMAEAMKTQMEDGAAFADLGLDKSSEEAVRRTERIDGVPVGMISDVFDGEEDTVLVANDGARVVLAKITGIQAFDPELPENAAVLAQIEAQMGTEMAFDLLSLYTEALEAEAGVNINPALLNQVNNHVLGGG